MQNPHFLERGTLADLSFFCDPQWLIFEHAFGTVALVAEGLGDLWA